MFNLLYKELRLAAHPTYYIFMLMGALVIVPAYPYTVVFMFGCLACFITFMYGRETNDIYYTALLPVKKRDTVKAKVLLIVLVQMVQLLISLPFALVRVHVLPEGNPVGIDANVAYYGLGLVIYTVFNLLFVPRFFKTAHKVGSAFIVAMVPVTLCMIAVEVLVHVPGLAWLDSVAGADLVKQLPILAAGMVIYAAGIGLAFNVGVKRFERVDL